MICAASTPALRAPPIATVATGMPGGICTIAYSASTPCSALPASGTPITGFVVNEATTPGRCAAIPAPAMNTAQPSRSESVMICFVRSGERCADATVIVYGTPASSSAAAAWDIVSASESEPMMMRTQGLLSAIECWIKAAVHPLLMQCLEADVRPIPRALEPHLRHRRVRVLQRLGQRRRARADVRHAARRVDQPRIALDDAGVEHHDRIIVD